MHTILAWPHYTVHMCLVIAVAHFDYTHVHGFACKLGDIHMLSTCKYCVYLSYAGLYIATYHTFMDIESSGVCSAEAPPTFLVH